jgi:hypothetical protein
MVTALRTGFTSRFASDDATDLNYTQLQTYIVGTRLRHYSAFAPLGELRASGTYSTVTLDVVGGDSDLTFVGTGTMEHQIPETQTQGYSQLSGTQYSIPERVPLNTAMLNEWQIPGTSFYIRLNAGNVEGRPDQMRVCWDTEAFGISQASCSRHLKATGQPVGADSINRVAGRTYTHVTNDDAVTPRRVHQCVYTVTQLVTTPGATPGTPPTYTNQVDKKYSVDLFTFSEQVLYRNRAKFKEFVQGPYDPDTAGYRVIDLGAGATQEFLYDPRSSTEVIRRGNAVESYRHGFGAPGGGYGTSDQCSRTGGL